MTIAEIVEIEDARQDENTWNVIHLLKEGDFYRAHDWSAWLMTVCPFGEAMDKPLKVLAKKMKDGYIDAFCGFPASSIAKYVPNDGSVDFRPVNDIQIDITVELPADIGDVSFENLNKKKEEWKSSLPLNDKKHRREDREAQEYAPRFMRMSDVVGRLIALPLEDLSPKEAFNVLRDLRKQAIALF